MKSTTVKLDIQPEIFNATREFMDEKGLDIEQGLSESIKKFYSKYVPTAVRKYIGKTSVIDACAAPPRSAEPLSSAPHIQPSNENTHESASKLGSF